MKESERDDYAMAVYRSIQRQIDQAHKNGLPFVDLRGQLLHRAQRLIIYDVCHRLGLPIVRAHYVTNELPPNGLVIDLRNTTESLTAEMQTAVAAEEYERASWIQKELARRSMST